MWWARRGCSAPSPGWIACRAAWCLTSSRAGQYGEGAWIDRRTGAISYPGQRSRAQLERGQWDFPGLQCLPFDAAATTPNPTSVYGATKLAQEHILKSWALSFDVEIGLLRLQNVYGPGQSLSNPYTGIVSLFARLAREGKSIPVYEDGEIVRDFVFIDDVAEADPHRDLRNPCPRIQPMTSAQARRRPSIIWPK